MGEAKFTFSACRGRLVPDDGTGVSGYAGDQLGVLPFCEPVNIVDYAWDPYDAVYWVQIEHPTLNGWLKLELISTIE